MKMLMGTRTKRGIMRVLFLDYGSGKTYLAERLVEYLGDKVACPTQIKLEKKQTIGTSIEEGRLRQNKRMLSLCENAEAEGKIAIADFVAPFEKARRDFSADYEVFIDTIYEGRFEDTNKVFERPMATDYFVTNNVAM